MAELGNTKSNASFFCIACRFLKQNEAKEIINATGHVLPILGKLLGESVNICYKSYLCYTLYYLSNIFESAFLVIYIFLRLKIQTICFLRFLKISKGGNPEATICFAVI